MSRGQTCTTLSARWVSLSVHFWSPDLSGKDLCFSRRPSVRDVSDSEEEFEECSEDNISESESEQETPNIEDCTPGGYILFRLTNHKYYLSSIVEVGDNLVTLKAARKYGEHNGKMTFCWPSIDDVFSVTGLTEHNTTTLPDPVIDRRGSTLTFRTSAFGKVALNYIM